MLIPVPFPPPPRGFAGLSALVPRASRILSCASSLSSTLNFHDAKSCFLSGTTISGCTAGPDDPACESPESAPGRIGPAGACAAAPRGNVAHAVQKIAPTATLRVKVQIALALEFNVPVVRIVLLTLAVSFLGGGRSIAQAQPQSAAHLHPPANTDA